VTLGSGKTQSRDRARGQKKKGGANGGQKGNERPRKAKNRSGTCKKQKGGENPGGQKDPQEPKKGRPTEKKGEPAGKPELNESPQAKEDTKKRGRIGLTHPEISLGREMRQGMLLTARKGYYLCCISKKKSPTDKDEGDRGESHRHKHQKKSKIVYLTTRKKSPIEV